MISIDIHQISNMTREELKSLLLILNISVGEFHNRLAGRIFELEKLIGQAASIQGDAHTVQRSNATCEMLWHEQSLCKNIQKTLDHRPQNPTPRPFSRAEIRRIVAQQRLDLMIDREKDHVN